eukprot:CAMPEP_0184686232 /NCGR_PEP_ID=MMETSP0312-20130426/21728_1 /TAXON_ID=31354 /ORGANISM="Compsopogon coeruleus, Strain SAG 36.94" /LENGTH=363 /DNA_ID=CAMNT_0027141115 /DNA_START=177 /DNA_END=1265 /DNA_ORIENTATION=-
MPSAQQGSLVFSGGHTHAVKGMANRRPAEMLFRGFVRNREAVLIVLVLALGYEIFSSLNSEPGDFVVPSHERATQRGLAFFIQVSRHNIHMVPRLIHTLYSTRSYYVLHFDANIPDQDVMKVMSDWNDYHNVRILPNRDTIAWGGITIVLNVISAMQYLLEWAEATGTQWTHFLFISGSHYPLVAVQDMEGLLHSFRGTSFAKFNRYKDPVPWNNFHQNFRLKMEYMHWDEALFEETPPESTSRASWMPQSRSWCKLPTGAIPQDRAVMGEAWMVLSHKFVDFVVHDTLAKRILVRISLVHAPDEWYFQNLMWAGPKELVGDVRNDAMTYVSWDHKKIDRGNETTDHPLDLVSSEMFFPELNW